jgi:DNA-binding XRE family transcriptional regulator
MSSESTPAAWEGTALFREWRAAQPELSQGDAGAAIGGVSQTLVSFWETGRRRPTLLQALAMQAVTGISPASWGYTPADVETVRALVAHLPGDTRAA